MPDDHRGQPLDGWGLVITSAIALAVAVLVLVGRGRWAWTRPLAVMTSGLLAGVLLMSVLSFAELTSWDYRDESNVVNTSAGPAVWLRLPAGLLAIVVAILAMSGGRRAPLPPNPAYQPG